MNRKELTRKMSSMMRADGIGKEVVFPKSVFHITDDEGNKRDFTIRKSNKTVYYTPEEIDEILQYFADATFDALKGGDHVTIRGFGTFALKYRKPRRTIHPVTNEDVVVAGRYVPKFKFGKDLRLCARLYEMSIEDGEANKPIEPLYDEEDFILDDEDGDI